VVEETELTLGLTGVDAGRGELCEIGGGEDAAVAPGGHDAS
jgi:hypothetical protein